MSPTISRMSRAPVEVRAGRKAAKIATEIVLAPGSAVLDTPTIAAARASRAHAHGIRSSMRPFRLKSGRSILRLIDVAAVTAAPSVTFGGFARQKVTEEHSHRRAY